jgi:pimeloyl-ACP methyl ester carboxylesterase
MIAPLAKFIDWSVLQIRTKPKSLKGAKPHTDKQTGRLEEAFQFLKGPDFIPAESQAARVEFNPDQSGLHFRFPSPRPGDIEENNIVHGRLYRCAGRWQERPVIILLHGGWIIQSQYGPLSYRFVYPLVARRCNWAGFNAATLEAPYHFQRQPRRPAATNQPDYLRSAEAAAQAIVEIRALIGWLLGEGCPAVALWGVSMGGWQAGLTVCRDARLRAVVMTVPVVHSNPKADEWLIWRSVRDRWRRERAAEEKLDMTPFNLTTARPVIPRENILLIGGVHDLICPMESIEELWQSWGQTNLWRLPQGHNSFMMQPGLTGRVLCWLAPRLNQPSVHNVQITPPNRCRQPPPRLQF